MGDLSTELFSLVGLLVFVLPVVIFFRRRSKYKAFPLMDGALHGTLADLERAEKELELSPAEMRERILVDYEPFRSLETFSGSYTQDYVLKLISYLNQNGVAATFLFQQSLPTGVLSASEPHGQFELFVARGNRARAIELFESFRKN